MRLNPKAFDAFLAGDSGIGQEFLWRRSWACPCRDPHSGAADPQCPQCSGKGRIWGQAVPGRAGMTAQNIKKEWIQAGLYESGDATITVPESSPIYEAGQFDRLTLLNSTDAFSVSLTRGDVAERLWFRVAALSRVFWIDGDGVIVDGGLPSVSEDGIITWGSGAPDVGVQYSISGTKFNEYYIPYSMPSDRAEHYGARLPKKIIARAFDLFGR